jgi:hypothetical protein
MINSSRIAEGLALLADEFEQSALAERQSPPTLRLWCPRNLAYAYP